MGPENTASVGDTSKKNFRLHRHANGSHTLVDLANNQAMHSRIGPALEAEMVYAARARIEESLNQSGDHHVLYDVGLGTGANVLAVLNRIQARPETAGRLEVYSFESKPEGLRTALENLDAFPELLPWQAPLRELIEKSAVSFRIGEVAVTWRLVAEDFYTRMEDCPAPDTLFFDFYSPKVVPELWSAARFAQIFAKIGGRPARLFTYSAATPVRLHFFAAGFFVGSGISTGLKTETTVAATRFDLLESPLPKAWLTKLTTSASIAGAEFAESKSRVLNHPQWAPNP